ncbi:MAG: L-threonylcarbamoyladenylate synthase [Acidobacteriia bacterium]|nr:L-threonylcarbamoyladenylate synthase [Terriglobia bacterium]
MHVSTEIITLDRRRFKAVELAPAGRAIQRGRVVAFPTDTFYGLAADPFNLSAVERVYQIKGRPRTNPLLLLIGEMAHVKMVAAEIPEIFSQIAEKFWPGPLTLVLKASHRLPLKVTGGTGNIGVRLPDSELARALVQSAGVPLTATSANLSTLPSCTTASQVLDQLGGRVDILIDGGAVSAKKPSTVLDLTSSQPSIIREGAIGKEKLKRWL